MTGTPLDFYAHHSAITNPVPYVTLFDSLPDDLSALHQMVQNVYIHVWKIRKYHPDWLEGRTHEIASRTVSRSLSLVLAYDSRALTEERPKEHKLIVDCRHFATLLCTLLRQKGIPARVRVGFATYLENTHYQDHWVCEYWNGERWVLEDPDLKMHDVSPDQFIVSGRAWQMIQKGETNGTQFGFGPDMRGEWAVFYDLVRDFAMLNRMEVLTGDSWGILLQPFETLNPAERTLLDDVALKSQTVNDDFAAMHTLYENGHLLRVPEIVTYYNYVANTSEPVKWDDRV